MGGVGPYPQPNQGEKRGGGCPKQIGANLAAVPEIALQQPQYMWLGCGSSGGQSGQTKSPAPISPPPPSR